jgi:hypothetical protein
MAGASIINAAVLHSAAVTMTVPLCAAFTLIAATRRAQIRNLAAAITRRRQPPAFHQNDQDRRPSPLPAGPVATSSAGPRGGLSPEDRGQVAVDPG